MPAQTLNGLEVIIDESESNQKVAIIYSKLHNLTPESIQQAIKGVAIINYYSPDRIPEVYSVWARNGYGPILMQIAFEITKGCIIGGEACTPEAENVMREFYQGKGRHLVDIEDNQGYEGYGEPHLQALYRNNSPLNIPASTLPPEIQQQVCEIALEKSETELRKIY